MGPLLSVPACDPKGSCSWAPRTNQRSRKALQVLAKAERRSKISTKKKRQKRFSTITKGASFSLLFSAELDSFFGGRGGGGTLGVDPRPHLAQELLNSEVYICPTPRRVGSLKGLILGLRESCCVGVECRLLLRVYKNSGKATQNMRKARLGRLQPE